MEKDDYLVKLDYKVSSVGVILMEEAEIGKIELIPDPAIFKHRIDERAISIHYSPDNHTYYKLPKDKWNFALDEEGRVEIILKETVTAKAFKVHCKADDRNKQNEYVDISTFYNDINEIVNIYQRSDSAKIEYEYDAGGNRTERHTIVGNDDKTEYEYYENSNRLKRATYSISGEIYKEWYYIYDANGNLVAKGNEVTESADGSLSLVKDTVSSRYWEYEYSADNRLKAVYYLGELQAEYNYDANGKRIVSDTEEKTTYFVFNYAGKAVFEEKVDANSDSGESSIKQTSFIYALSKQIARVEGVVGGDGEVVYYHHDNLGSTRMMTDESGEIVFNQDYLPFGGDLAVVDKLEAVNDVDEGYKYTGQKEEASIGLYYYGARFYDPEIGRFISEDTYAGELINPQSQNIYIYVLANPLKYVDPGGHSHSYYRGMAYDYYYNTDQPTSEGFNDYLENNKAEDLSRYVNDYFIGAGKTILDTVNPVTYYNMLKFGAFYSNAGPGVQVIINTQISLNLQQQYQDFRQKPIGQKNDVMMQIMGGVTADYFIGLGVSKGISKLNKSLAMLDDLNGFKFVDGADANGVFDDMIRGTGRLNNPFPNNGRFATAMPKEYAQQPAKGQGKLSGGLEAWITAADDLRNLNTIEEVAKRLTLVDENKVLRLHADAIVEFGIEDMSGISSPFNRKNPGFIDGGRTGGGAREWLVPSDISIYDVIIRYLKR